MELIIKYTNNRYRRDEYYLRRKYNSKAKLPALVKCLIAQAVAKEAQIELDEIQLDQIVNTHQD